MTARLIEANVQNEVEPLDEVASLLRNVKTGWDAIG
jgi:flagellar protein FliS